MDVPLNFWGEISSVLYEIGKIFQHRFLRALNLSGLLNHLIFCWVGLNLLNVKDIYILIVEFLRNRLWYIGYWLDCLCLLRESGHHTQGQSEPINMILTLQLLGTICSEMSFSIDWEITKTDLYVFFWCFCKCCRLTIFYRLFVLCHSLTMFKNFCLELSQNIAILVKEHNFNFP